MRGESRRLLIPDSSILNDCKSLGYHKSKCKYQVPIVVCFEFALDDQRGRFV